MSNSKKTKTLFSYVDALIPNEDGVFDLFGSSWFIVPEDWLEMKIVGEGVYPSLEEFFNSYVYHETRELFLEALAEGVLLGCGTGDMEEVKNG